MDSMQVGDGALFPIHLVPQATESQSDYSSQSESISDSASVVTGSPPPPETMPLATARLQRLDDDDKARRLVERLFLRGMGELAARVSVAAVHRCTRSNFFSKARDRVFRLYADAVAANRGGGNVKCAWFGASNDVLRRVVAHGFAGGERPSDGVLFGSGVYLSPANSSFPSAISSAMDEDGLRHILLCRVIMGKAEEVPAGSSQCHPSSDEFDSGVDNLASPNWFVVWPSHMNTHILPEFLLTFTTTPNQQVPKREVSGSKTKPTSEWMPFPKLISLLGGVLPPPSMDAIMKYHAQYLNRMMSRECLVRRVRGIAGDKLLVAAIRAFRSKAVKIN